MTQTYSVYDINPSTTDEGHFYAIADILMNYHLLLADTSAFRICELEFYLKSDCHPDPYTHCNPDQLKYGTYYFHKHNTVTYKSGTFKGMDITLGDEATSSYFGILVRAVYNIKTKEFTEGPCNVVHAILKCYNLESINALTNNQSLNIWENSQNLILQPVKRNLSKFTNSKFPYEEIYFGPRIGLGDPTTELHHIYVNSPYRFIIQKEKIKKNKKTLEKVLEDENDYNL